MGEIADKVELVQIGHDVDESILDAVRLMVKARREADDTRGAAAAYLLAMTLSRGGSREIYPPEFAKSILPFWQAGKSSEPTIRALVPVSQVFGASRKWFPWGADKQAWSGNVAAFKSFLLNPDRSAGLESERSIMFWVRPLGMFFSHEGKNRVAYLASENEEWMSAEVIPSPYPAAADLKLYHVEIDTERLWLCIREGKFAVLIEQPAWTLPILRAYGVNEGNPRDLRRAAEIVVGIRRGTRLPGQGVVIDWQGFDIDSLPHMRQDLIEESQPVARHDQVKLDVRSLLVPWVMTVAITLLGLVLCHDGVLDNLRQTVGAGMVVGGLSAMGGFFACIQLLRVTVRERVKRG